MGRLVGCSYSHRKGKGRQSQFNSPGSSAIRRCSRGRTNDLGKQNKEVKKTETYRLPTTHSHLHSNPSHHERGGIPGSVKGYPVAGPGRLLFARGLQRTVSHHWRISKSVARPESSGVGAVLGEIGWRTRIFRERQVRGTFW